MTQQILQRHPCFSPSGHGKFGRIHLPVAPKCNIQCAYCLRKYDCANESRPGITSKVLSPKEALERVQIILDRNENLTVIGIAGPGDPLANEETFETLYRIKREFPHIILCISTNGLLLAEKIDELIDCGVKSVTITINAVNINTASRLYNWISLRGKRYSGFTAAGILISQQWRGLTNAIDAGLIVKVNTVYCPSINDDDIPEIAKQAGQLGAEVMNLIPLIPQADLSYIQRPNRQQLHEMRQRLSPFIRQMTNCRQCRADACGTLGEDIDMELMVLYDRIQEDYCDMVS